MIDEAGDQAPATVSGYQYSGFEADTDAMAQFAAKLKTNVQKSYVPQRDKVVNAMMTPLPDAPLEFSEWFAFLSTHNAAQNVTLQNVWNFGDGSHAYAEAAQAIGEAYQGSDAFSHATVHDVDKRLHSADPAAPANPTGTGDL
jgi:hypothetical protein